MGRPKTGGRQKGSLNKVTLEIRELAAEYGPRALTLLWAIAQTGETDAAKVAAIRELLDRGYGKPPQDLTHKGDENKPLTMKISWQPVTDK